MIRSEEGCGTLGNQGYGGMAWGGCNGFSPPPEDRQRLEKVQWPMSCSFTSQQERAYNG